MAEALVLTAGQEKTLRELPHFRTVRRLANGEIILKGATRRYVLDRAGNVRPLRERRRAA